jgi:hypothetical protein
MVRLLWQALRCPNNMPPAGATLILSMGRSEATAGIPWDGAPFVVANFRSCSVRRDYGGYGRLHALHSPPLRLSLSVKLGLCSDRACGEHMLR